MSIKEAVIADKDQFSELANKPSFRQSELVFASEFQSANIVEDDFIRIFFSKLHRENTQSAQIDPLSIKSIIPEQAFTLPQNVFTYPVFSLPKHSLRAPIEVVVQTDESNNVILWNDDFGVCGIGNCIEKALEEFEELIFTDYASLKNIKEKNLSNGAKELIKKYKEFLG